MALSTLSGLFLFGYFGHFPEETLPKFSQSLPLVLALVWAGHFVHLQGLCCQNFGRSSVSKFFHMNQTNGAQFLQFHPSQRIRINIHVDRKIFYQQRIVYMFGPQVLGEILASPLLVVIPMINYKTSFDVHVFILF